MNGKNDTPLTQEIDLVADLLSVKKLLRELQQISYSMKKTEDRFPEIEFANKEEILKYIRVAVAYKYDIEDILKQLEKYYDKYKDKS